MDKGKGDTVRSKKKGMKSQHRDKDKYLSTRKRTSSCVLGRTAVIL